MATAGDRLDLVVFGATGFTGQFVVEEIARIETENAGLSWGIAGRSRAKLEKIRQQAAKETGRSLEHVEILVADVSDQDSLDRMASRSKVVINCVGPYRFYGEQVVKACVNNGASTVDISGEPQFLEGMQFKYHEAAEKAGVYVVGACGFDSIPADMGTCFVHEKFDGDLNGIESYFKVQTGPKGYRGIHYATYQSAIHGFANAHELGPLRKQLFGKRLPRSNHKLPNRGNLHYSDVISAYCLPFLGSDKSVVQRSVFHNYETRGWRNIQYSPYVGIGGMLRTVGVTILLAFFGLMASFNFGRTLLEKYPRAMTLGAVSHDGPTREQMAETSFSMTFVASGWKQKAPRDEQHSEKPDQSLVARVSGPECGYIATPICLVQSAITILKEADKMPGTGGVYSPGAAFLDSTLIQRLTEHDVKFEVLGDK
ncbi:saccharopine dehydrogenase-like oxidoreductase [Amphibalanus amphitrite]|uniref:saccharopine dehydrogenase-like oxidoreductase n=1 Tax=Amphibalanus amphitrite TaxID=1232801 RepID=UPI001C8FB66D|nr:saccharopine dehydrogenase-like oxidoreductase [Amphibalanus amphitrite]